MVLVAAAATFTACSDDNAGEQYLRENTTSPSMLTLTRVV